MPSSRAKNQSENLYVNFTFLLDGKPVNAIRTEPVSLSEMQQILAGKFGADRVTNIQARGLKK